MPSLSLLVVVSALAAAALPPPAAVRIALELDPGIPEAIGRLAVSEAAAIWRPYGVTIVGPEAIAACLPFACVIQARLPVRIDDAGAIGEAELMPLAGIKFGPDAMPEGVIRLRYRLLMARGVNGLASGGVHESQWPRALRTLVVGRIVGRVIAHEIGHWLLQTPIHAPNGLMRAVQLTSDLADPDRSRYSLTAPEVGRLRAIVAGQPKIRR